MTNLTNYELNYCEIPEMSVQIGYLQGDGNSTQHGITLRAESQPFNITHVAHDGSEISFVVNDEREKELIQKQWCKTEDNSDENTGKFLMPLYEHLNRYKGVIPDIAYSTAF